MKICFNLKYIVVLWAYNTLLLQQGILELTFDKEKILFDLVV